MVFGLIWGILGGLVRVGPSVSGCGIAYVCVMLRFCWDVVALRVDLTPLIKEPIKEPCGPYCGPYCGP